MLGVSTCWLLCWLQGSEAVEERGVQYTELKLAVRSPEECVLAGWMQNGGAAVAGVKLLITPWRAFMENLSFLGFPIAVLFPYDKRS